MELLAALILIVPNLVAWLEAKHSKKALKDDRGQRAVEAILRAVNETTLFLAATKGRRQSDRKREDALSRHWSAAASALHGINDDLAMRCQLKGKYWASPTEWTEADLRKARLMLDQVSSDALAVLGWAGPSRRGGTGRRSRPTKLTKKKP